MQTINNIPYQVNRVAKEVSLMPIEGIHDVKIVADTKLTLDVQYLDYDVNIDWQKP